MSFPSQGYTPSFSTVTLFSGNLITQVTNLVRTANQEWFASDIIPTPANNVGSELILIFAFSERTIIEVTFDSGVTWYALNNNLRVEEETLNSFGVPVLNTDLVNFRAKEAGTIRTARVLERI